MIKGLREEDLEVVVRISGKLGVGWSFHIVGWLDGVQCNWVRDGVSMMWRSVSWDRETVERYELNGRGIEMRYEIEELKG